MNIIVTTASGARYEFSADGSQVRRLEGSDGNTMRRDGEWVRLLRKPDIWLGEPMVLELEPLGEGTHTTRRTTRVVDYGQADA